ncbi:unnamed protein product [Polarella glacialis]|uniref:FH2 domain-containing protein n=1 Tax=Polarella glacialis TaxID=89957 RepID=A0A813K7M1_POLGL|nr:unnamed protein product [Polarella glacialis]
MAKDKHDELEKKVEQAKLAQKKERSLSPRCREREDSSWDGSMCSTRANSLCDKDAHQPLQLQDLPAVAACIDGAVGIAAVKAGMPIPPKAGPGSAVPCSSKPSPVTGKAAPPGPPPLGFGSMSPRGMPPGPPPPAAKGGKAKAPPPPPISKAKSKAKARASIATSTPGLLDLDDDDEALQEQDGRMPRPSGAAKLVNLHWRASHAPPQETEMHVENDSYLFAAAELMHRWRDDRSERMKDTVSGFEDRVGSKAAAKAAQAEEEAAVERVTAESSSGSRRRRHTVFSATTDVPVYELPHHSLEEFFQARSSAFDMGSRASTAVSVSSLIADGKHRQILDIIVRKEVIYRHRTLTQQGQGQVAVDLAVEELLAALLRCDYSRIMPCMVDDLHKVVCSHLEGGHNILSYVEGRGEQALDSLEHPHLHRLLFGLMRIPAIPVRLECMALQLTFQDNIANCRENLEALSLALQNVSRNLGPLRQLWALVLQLGNALNRGSPAPVSERGFKLSTLPKLLELRSPHRKEASLLHFALLLMKPSEVDELCQPDFVYSLQQAQAKRTHTVYLDLLTQLDSFRHIQTLAGSGRYKGQDVPRCTSSKSQVPESSPEQSEPPLALDEDAFFKTMSQFVESGCKEVGNLWRLGKQVFEGYRDLGLLFEDLLYVFPPPKDDADTKKDLFDIFAKFINSIIRARAEIDSLGLDKEVKPKAEGLTNDATPASPKSAEATVSATTPVLLRTPLATLLTLAPISPSDTFGLVLNPLAASPDREGPLVEAARAAEFMFMQLPKSPLKKSPGLGLRRHLEVNFSNVADDPPVLPEQNNEEADDPLNRVLGALGSLPLEVDEGNVDVTPNPETPTCPPPQRAPPQQRPLQVRSPLRSPPGPGRRQLRQGAYELPSMNASAASDWVLGAPPLNLGLLSGLGGASLGLYGSSPPFAPVTPGTAGSVGAGMDRTPPPGGVSRQARKSLTRLADRAEADFLGTSATRFRGSDEDSLISWSMSEFAHPSDPAEDDSPFASTDSPTDDDLVDGAGSFAFGFIAGLLKCSMPI